MQIRFFFLVVLRFILSVCMLCFYLITHMMKRVEFVFVIESVSRKLAVRVDSVKNMSCIA